MRLNVAHLRPLFKLGSPNTAATSGSAVLNKPENETWQEQQWRADPGEDEQMPILTLSELRAGSIGRVVSVQGEPHLALRILELGLVCGTPVRVVRTAPLGGPMEVEVEGFLLSLRRNEADAVRVEV